MCLHAKIYIWQRVTSAIKQPTKILSPFLCIEPLQYVPKIRFTQTTIDCLTTNKTKNVLLDETVILNYIGGEPISHSLSN